MDLPIERLMQYFAGVDWGAVGAGVLRVVLVLVIARVLIAALRSAFRRFEQELERRAGAQGEGALEARKRAETLVRLLRQGVVLVIWVMAVLIILGQLGINIGPILASAGVAGLAVGFGAQNLVRDVISGFFLILENQVRVGDVAVVNGTGGLVEAINFRTLILRDLSGIVHIFPNGTINSLSNLTKEWSAYVFEIGVAYKEDTDHVVEVLHRVAKGLRADEYFGPLLIDDVEIFGVDQLADSAVIIKGRIRTRPIKQWEVGRQFLRRVKQAFDREGIEIPFPHRSLYVGEATKPLAVQILEGARGGTS
jgi:small conductance mechanosensitive channel